MSSFLKMFLATTASVSTASALLLYNYQLKLIYPSGLNDGNLPHSTPDEYGIPYEDLYIDTKDNEKLHAFLCLQKTSPEKKKTILILNPNAGNIGLALPIITQFYEMGFNVLAYDYRGYGQSSGKANEVGLKIDANTIMEFIKTHKIIRDCPLILYGRSLGGAVAIYIASQNYPIVQGVILENTFLSIRKTIPHIFPFLKYAVRLCHQVWDSESDIVKVNNDVKMLFLSAQLDEIVPPEHMDTLYKISGDRYKKFVLFEGAHHNDTTLYPGYWDIINDFLQVIED